MSIAVDSLKNGRLGVGQVEGLPQILSRRVSLQALRGSRQEDCSRPSFRAEVAGEAEVQEIETREGNQRFDASKARSWMVDEKAFRADAGEADSRED